MRKRIQEAINELVKNKILAVIAHKLSTIKNEDQIIVLDKGNIIERCIADAECLRYNIDIIGNFYYNGKQKIKNKIV